MNPFSFLKSKIAPAYLGVDIGTTSIKAVEVEAGKIVPRFVNYGLLESEASLARANTALQTSTLKLFDKQVAEFLNVLITQMRPRTRQTIASIPVFSAFTTVLSFPEMPPSELERALVFQARQYVPLPISEVALDWMKVGEYEDDKGFKYQLILLIAVPQELIKKYQRMFASVGLTLRALELESLSLSRALVGEDPTPTLIVDIGSRSTLTAVVEGGELKWNAQTDFGGSFITHGLSGSLGVTPLRAEELKRERGIIGVGPDYELSTVILPFLDVILGEVKRITQNYQAQFPFARKIERLLLSGGGANLLGIEKYVETQMGMPTAKAAPLRHFEYPTLIEPLTHELNPLLAVALGLTMREFV